MAKNIVSVNLDGTTYTGRPYGTCVTAGSVAAKVVSCSEFSLTEGATVLVKFSYENSASSPTLNVNSTGAKSIYYKGSTLSSSLYYWGDGNIVEFYYDGTYWNLISIQSDPNILATITLGSSAVFNGSATSAVTAGSLTTTRTIDGVEFNGSANVTRYASCSTASGTVAKTATITAGTYKLAAGAKVTVKFTYANTAANPTLNINSTGAKSIYWRGSAITMAQYWQAGAVLEFVYTGSQYELVGAANPNASMTTSTSTSVSISSMIPNVLYQYTGNCTSVSVSSFASGSGGVDEYMLEFKASSSGCTLSLPSGVSWMGGTAMTVEAGKKHQVSIVNNLAVGASFG